MLALFKLVFRVPTAVLGSLRRSLRKAKQYSNFVRFFQACCLCCINSYEKFFRYNTKHSLVQLAIWSSDFKTSAQRAWYLLFRNRETVKNVDFLATFLLFQTKVSPILLN